MFSKEKSIIVRYLILLLIAIPNLWIFYTLLTTLTVFPIFILTKFFFHSSLSGNSIIFSDLGFSVEIVKACVAGSAYYLLLILNLSIPEIKIKKRAKMILSAFGILLGVNILRIFLMIITYEHFSWPLFNVIHLIIWYSLSIIFIIGIWFWEVKKFKIKKIPVYSDMKYLLNKRHKK